MVHDQFTTTKAMADEAGLGVLFGQLNGLAAA